MSRPWILGIIACCLLACSTSVGWGQDYLDLPEEPSGGSSATLTDRFMSFKGKFSRKPKQVQQPKANSSQRSNPRAPRYRNQQSSRSASQAQRARLHAASKQLKKVPVSKPEAKPKTSRIATRPKSKDLLPESKLFSRSGPSHSSPIVTKLPKLPKRTTKQSSRAVSLARASSATSERVTQPAPKRIARKSPSISRANELDAALADLLHTKPVPKRKRVAVKSPKRKVRTPAPIASNSFDLRKALLDDEEDLLASEVAKAAEAPAKKPKAVAAVAKKAVKKANPQQVAKAKVEKPSVKKQKPVVKAAPTIAPVIVEPQLAKPVIIEPIILEPVVKPTLPKEVITIAKPRPSPTLPRVSPPAIRSAELASDPFESTAKQVFGKPQQTSNPMRAFQAASVHEQPAKLPANVIARPERGVLETSQQPVIVSRVEGPKSILVGREATYQITLENTSNTAARDLFAEINVPEWAELVDAMSTSGVVKRSEQGANAGALEWKLNDLPARSSQALRLRLIPRSGRPLQLGVRWSQAPVETQAIVEVQEPKLELTISGPKEVHFGKPQRYRLTLRNPGTGMTEQVALRLIPPGGDAQSAVTQKIGDLKAGEVRDIDLELTAREAGELLIQANAIADGGLKAEAIKTVLCRKPELKVDWRGPDKKYAGTVAAYFFRVRNPGTAATEPVEMSVKLPAGAEFVSASEGYSINAITGIVSWRLAAIGVNEEQFMQLRCKIARPGKNDFKLIAKTSDGQLSDSTAFQTDVIALADLKLEVTDPQGPLPLGESVAYEIRVRNRGTTTAENINIVGLFSEGIDPVTVEGAQYSLRDGRVSFHPIKILPAGREIVLRIHANANQVGTHIFRTEVTCPELDIKLAAEETTRFFQDQHSWEDGETPYTAERQSTRNR